MYSNVKHNKYICYLNFHSNDSGISDHIDKYFTNHLLSSSSTTEPQGRNGLCNILYILNIILNILLSVIFKMH